MLQVILNVPQLSQMQLASRAIALISVPWSPWPQKSREVLVSLETSQEQWSPQCPVEFFDVWPERDAELNRWYEMQCVDAEPKFELHGHGYGPLWWLANGKVLECLAKPYDLPLKEIQRRSAAIFQR
ncbi:MAG: hypothetical protein JWP89_4212 [Schlesneria sp.]|nr:hypothetical protein [Schlesneria sp.]